VFAPGKPPVDYQGARDVKPIAEFALQQVCWNLFLVVLTFYPLKFQSNILNMCSVTIWILDRVDRCLLFVENNFLYFYEKLIQIKENLINNLKGKLFLQHHLVVYKISAE
jgi:hypothetical protein